MGDDTREKYQKFASTPVNYEHTQAPHHDDDSKKKREKCTTQLHLILRHSVKEKNKHWKDEIKLNSIKRIKNFLFEFQIAKKRANREKFLLYGFGTSQHCRRVLDEIMWNKICLR